MRRLAAVLVLVLLGGAAVACGSDPGPAERFAHALSERDAATASDATTDPEAARAMLTASLDGMGDIRPQVSVTGDDDRELTWRWPLPKNREVTYTVPFTETDGRIEWTPTLIHRDMRANARLLYSDIKALDTPVLDRRNRPLLTWQTVTVVSLDAGRAESAAALARRLRPAAPEVTATAIRADLQGKTGPHTVIALRAADARRVGDLTDIEGVSVREEGRLLTAHKNLRSPAVSGLEEHWRTAVDDAAGAEVSIVGRDGAPVTRIQSFTGEHPAPVRTTLDTALARSAFAAVSRERRPAMIVAIRPSTGGILTVAQNAAADREGPLALTGMYAPGSTFKTITTAAALEAGITTANASLACPGRQRFGDRVIPNEDEFTLGTVPLHTAFARSCNTTMAGLSTRLGDDALATTAKRFGLGVDYTIPGLTTITGRVPAATSPAEKVESGIGQGRVTASPFGMAVVEASLAARRTVTPTLIEGTRAQSDTAPADIGEPLAAALRSFMREAVTSGTATSLRDIPGLGGKTGTAEFGDNRHSHGWFAGVVGDLAFATLVVGGDSSTPALNVTGDFLRGARDDLP